MIGRLPISVKLRSRLSIDILKKVRDKFIIFFQKFTWFDWLLMGLLCAGLIYLVLFGVSFVRPPRIGVEYLADQKKTSATGEKIWVDISGAVIKAGVYELPIGSRVKDALLAAGGLAAEADRSLIEEVLNLAKVMVDGEKIYIPFKAEVSSVQGDQTSRGVSGKININKASSGELESLAGIGPSRSALIIKNRPYAAVDELLTKKVLTKGVLEAIRTEIGVF